MKTWRISLLLGITTLGLCACQATPSEDVVVNKDEGILQSQMQVEKSESTLDMSKDKKSEVVMHVTDDFKADMDDIQIHIDTDVTQSSDIYPVVRVKPKEITVDEVKHWADILFKGNTAYEYSDRMTKSELEEEILDFTSRLNDKQSFINEYGSEEAAEEAMEYYRQKIEEDKILYETAEDSDGKETDWTFHPLSYYYSTTDTSYEDDYELNIQTEIDGHKATIKAVNRMTDDLIKHNISFNYIKPNLLQPEKKELTEDEARKVAEKVINELLDANDWSFFNMEIQNGEDSQWLTLTYTPKYKGVPSLFAYYDSLNFKDEDDTYDSNYAYTSLEINIFNGVFYDISLTSASEVVEVVNENVELMDMDTLIDNAKNYMKLRLTQEDFVIGDPNIHSIEVNIDKIQTGLFRIKEKNADTFLMVPAIMFYGSGYGIENKPILAVNALDGSFININLGY